MTSVIRSYANTQVLPFDTIYLTSAYYSTDTEAYQLFPFVYANGVLDLAPDEYFTTNYIQIPEMKPEDTSCSPVKRYSLMGGKGVVTKLGPTFLKYIRAAWSLTQTSPIRIQQSSVMTRVQEKGAEIDDGEFFSDYGFYESPTPPSVNVDVRTYWVFASPLTISILNGGTQSYITFATTIGHDSC